MRRRKRSSSWRSVEEIILPTIIVLAGLTLAGIEVFPIVLRVSTDDRRLDVRSLPEPTAFVRLGDLDVDVLPRSAWDARAPIRTVAPLGTPTRITVHHEGAKKFESTNLQVTARRIHSIQEYHQSTHGWSDIGYHLIVDRAGRAWEGRSLATVGAHAGNRATNLNNLGIMLLGNYDLQQPSTEQRATLLVLLEGARRAWNIPKSQLFTHGEIRVAAGLGMTDCPGKNVAEIVKAFRDDKAGDE